MPLESIIEAILFFRAEPMSFKELAQATGYNDKSVRDSVEILVGKLEGHGIKLMIHEDTVMLATAPEAAEALEKMAKDELGRDMGKASLETLTIILYRGPVSRSDIDHIRGVNSTFILRNLLIRGLIERVPNPNDSRSFVYKPSLDLLAHLGVSKIEELPEYETLEQSLTTFISEKMEEDGEATGN